MEREVGIFPRGHFLRRIAEACGVGEAAFRQPDPPAIGIHPPDKGGFRASDAFGQRNGGIIAGLHNQTSEKIRNLHTAVERREHGRTAGGRATSAPGILRDDELILKLQPALPDLIEDHAAVMILTMLAGAESSSAAFS